MKENKINPKDLEPGDVVQYEEKYRAAAVVRITEDLSDEDYLQYKAEIIDEIFGFGGDSKFTFGRTKNESFHHYIDWKIKPPGSQTKYFISEEIENRIEEIRQKYDG